MATDAVHALLLELDPDLRRIAGWARGDYNLNEIRSHAWICATEMAQRALTPLDWRDSAIRKELIRRVRNRCVYSERKHRNLLRLDRARRIGDDDSLPALIDTLAAPEVSDPLVELLEQEHIALQSPQPDRPWHHSQGTAYLNLVERLGMRALAQFLRISLSHCYRRCERAAIPDREQQGMLAIGARARTAHDALRPWRHYKIHLHPWQMELDFDAGTDLLSALT